MADELNHFVPVKRETPIEARDELSSGFAWKTSLAVLDLVIQHQAGLSFCVTPSLSTIQVVPEFSTRLPIAYAIRLGLGPTYPGRISLPQETLGFRRKGYSSLSRYLCRHHLFHFVQVPHGSPSTYHGMLPYRTGSLTKPSTVNFQSSGKPEDFGLPPALSFLIPQLRQ